MAEKLDPVVKRTTWAVLVAAMAVVFDTTIVAVALNSLAQDLHTSIGTIQWVTTGYLLALGVTIPVVGWAQRRIGGKRLWLAALTIFLFGSVLSSLAWNAPSLIAFRAVQGIGGGVMLPMISTLIMQAAGGKNLGRIMSLAGLPIVLGPVLGPTVGGLILEHLHWPWLFWVNVPFCLAGLVLGVVLLPADGPTSRPPFDLVGLLLMSPALVGLLYGLSNANRSGAFTRLDVYGPVLAGVVLLVAFGVHALRRGQRALIDVGLFRHWPLASSTILLFLSGGALYGAMLLLPLYFQQVGGTDALGAGLLLIPQGLGTLVSRFLTAKLADAVAARWLAVIGFAIVAAGTVPFAVVGDPMHGTPLQLTALFVRGFGLGIVIMPVMALAFRGLSRQQVPDASIITRVAQQVGGSFGTAVFAVLLEHAVSTTGALLGGYHEAFWWAAGLGVPAVLLALLLPGKASPAMAPQPEPARTAST